MYQTSTHLSEWDLWHMAFYSWYTCTCCDRPILSTSVEQNAAKVKHSEDQLVFLFVELFEASKIEKQSIFKLI